MLPAVIKHRLRPGGRALLCCAVREQVRRGCKGEEGGGQECGRQCARQAGSGSGLPCSWFRSVLLRCSLLPFAGRPTHLAAPAPYQSQAMFDAVAEALAALGLRAAFRRVQPAAADVLDIRQDYEGGYTLVAVEHVAAPAAADWPRDDLFGDSSSGPRST
jgi:hypothetical protein